MDNTANLSNNRMMKSREFAHNLTLLNRCKRHYSVMGIVYLVPIAIYFLATFGYGMSTGSFTPFLIALIECPLLAFLAFRSFYSHRDLSLIIIFLTLTAVQLTLWKLAPYEPQSLFKFNIISKCFWIHLIFALIIAAVAVFNIFTNITYHKLEAADGFPHFNERMFDQEMDRRQYGIKDPYQQQMEERMRTASDTMSDIGMPDAAPKSSAEEHKPGEMQSL